MKTVEKMFEGPVDVVGDIHGQFDAFQDLLHALKYSADGSHPENRKLIFVGDLVDRGPDSPAVVETVMNMAEAGNAQSVLGNHELNIVRGARKLDNGWYFTDPERPVNGQRCVTAEQQATIHRFLSTLPLALERDDLRVVHACWNPEAIKRMNDSASGNATVGEEYGRYRDETDRKLESAGTLKQYRVEQEKFDDLVRYNARDPDAHWPGATLLEGYARVNETRQMDNPIAVLTSGEERAAKKTYPAGGKFRFVDRVAWWHNYRDEQAVIIGHYWRLYNIDIVERPRAAGIDVFKGTQPDQWMGAQKNVYCVDFSVGGRGKTFGSDVCRLAAVRWPEATVMFDNGEELQTDIQR
jgi:hypothetical protein